MTQEERQLLLVDLSARFPYNVAIRCKDEESRFICYLTSDMLRLIQNNTFYWDYKPYLFPLSSITEKQKEEYCDLQQKVIYNSKGLINSDVMEYVNWCYKHHVDINNLIPMGLANDATGLNIY